MQGIIVGFGIRFQQMGLIGDHHTIHLAQYRSFSRHFLEAFGEIGQHIAAKALGLDPVYDFFHACHGRQGLQPALHKGLHGFVEFLGHIIFQRFFHLLGVQFTAIVAQPRRVSVPKLTDKSIGCLFASGDLLHQLPEIQFCQHTAAVE